MMMMTFMFMFIPPRKTSKKTSIEIFCLRHTFMNQSLMLHKAIQTWFNAQHYFGDKNEGHANCFENSTFIKWKNPAFPSLFISSERNG